MVVVLVITSHGTKIGKKQQMFKITRPETEFQEELFAAETVEEIIVEATGSISTEAIKLASRYAIPILFVYGNEPLACITPFVAHGTVKTRREQIKAYETKVGVEFCKAIIESATKNKMKIIKDLVRVRTIEEETLAKITGELEKIDKLKENVMYIECEKIDECREKFFAKEAEIAKQYYNCLKLLLPKNINFKGRTRNPPKDPVNALLSYGYAILTSQIHTSVIIAGLEAYAGFLHTDRSGKISFVLDLIEIFRQPVVDKLVITLIEKKIIKKENFDIDKEGVRIKEETKKKYLKYLFERLKEENVNYFGNKTSFKKIFVDQARKAGQFFVNKRKYFIYSMS